MSMISGAARVVAAGPRHRLLGAMLATMLVIAASASAVAPRQARGSSAPAAPLEVSAASLTQQGQDLVWQVELAAPFSPGALAADGRSLCLMIGRAARSSRGGELCVAGPRPHSGKPRLLYTPTIRSGHGAARLVTATITRSSDRELTARFLPSAVDLPYAPLRWQVISAVQPPGGGIAVFPSEPALLRVHEPQLVGCVARGPTWVFQGPVHAREIALTFDDGPWYQTAQFVDLLDREHVVATFFQIGDQVSEFAQHGLDRRMLADGDMIGDHTWNHRDIAAGGAEAVSEISQAAAAIRRATGGFQPCLFRAPYGAVSPALLATARRLGFTTIQWDIDPRDWATPGTSAIYDNVVRNAHDGAIVIQHDGGGNRSETLAALPVEIAALRREGYRFVTVTQLLGYQLRYR